MLKRRAFTLATLSLLSKSLSRAVVYFEGTGVRSLWVQPARHGLRTPIETQVLGLTVAVSGLREQHVSVAERPLLPGLALSTP